MSVKVMGAVWDADLPRDEKYILLSYADHAAHDGTEIYPSVGRTAWKTGYTTRSVQIITKKLIARKALIKDGKGYRGTNKYRIDLITLPRRKGYMRGEDSSGRRIFGGGVKKTAQGGEESSSNTSLTISKPSLVDARASTSPAPKKQSALAPDTEQSRGMFERLRANAEAKGRRGPKRFPTLECKIKFDTAATVLGAEFDEALDKALEQGITRLTGVTNYVAKWAANIEKRQGPQCIEIGM